MLTDRLSIALERGLVTVPETGAIGVFGARSSHNLDALPKDRTRVITRYFPEHTHFESLGFDVSTRPDGRFMLTIVALPRAKDDARQLIAQAAALSDGPVVVDGQNTDGIDGILRDFRAFGIF